MAGVVAAQVVVPGCLLGELLATILKRAGIGALAGVASQVIGQGCPLGEAHLTIFKHAGIGTLSGVDEAMHCQVIAAPN